MTHELSMKQHQEEDVKKKRIIVLKSTAQPDEESDDTEKEEQDEEMALITRRFKKLLKKRRQKMRKRPPTKGKHSKEKDKEQPLICYECKKSGHRKFECLQLKKGSKKYRKKAMMATWSESDESSSEK